MFPMTAPSELELQGNFLTHPFADLVAEIRQARLTGSLRLSAAERKCVVYFKNGRVAFAVSNARSSRIFEILIQNNRISKAEIAKIPNFANDMALADHLEDAGFFTREVRDQLFHEQIKAILIEILSWPSGDWSYSSLARLRDGLNFKIDVDSILIDYSRCLPVDAVMSRFRHLDETFARAEQSGQENLTNPNEKIVRAAISGEPARTSDIIRNLPIPEAAAIQSLYTLWLGGMVVRTNWNPAFTEIKIASIRDAKLALKKEAKLPAFNKVPESPVDTPDETIEPVNDVPVEKKISIEEYLERVKTAENHYDILGVEPDADIAVIKRSYFALARTFHPDHYHKDGGELLKRVQTAFTELTNAHETLKNPVTREAYDFKIRKELAEREKLKSSGSYDDVSRRLQQAADNFERGFGFLLEDEAETAIPFLARAVHLAPENPKYHAYYGRALATDTTQRHKAESEMQTAVRLDGDNPTYRIMLAEFFVNMNLLKRAEGELNRLLAIFPSNREARELLDSLKLKS